MQRRIYSVLFCLFLMNASFSQSMKEIISDQFDKIVSLPMKDKAFTISAFLGPRVYVLQQAKDSLLAFCYTPTGSDAVRDVNSISVNDDSTFLKVVASLFIEIKQGHGYLSYTKETLANGNFFLTFNERNKLQLFSRKEASPGLQKNMNYILGRLNGYVFNKHLNSLDITNLNGLLKLLK